MGSERKIHILSIAACAGLALVPARSIAVVTFGAGSNTTTAPGNLQNYEGSFDSGYLATPINPTTILTSAHLYPSNTTTFVYNNGTSVATTYTVQIVATLDDLAVWQIAPGQSAAFTLTAPVYTGPAATGQQAVDLGRGYSRGSAITGGWSWGGGQGPISWGSSAIAATPMNTDLNTTGSSGGSFLQFDFNNQDPQSSTYNPNEFMITPYDSGGGAFINVGGQYELAGVNSFYGARIPEGNNDFVYSVADSTGVTPIAGTLYNTSGYYYLNATDDVTPIITKTPESSFATDVSSKQNFIAAAGGSLSSAALAAIPINDDGKFTVLSNLTTGAFTGDGSLQLGMGASTTAKLTIAPNSGTSEIRGFNVMANSTLDLTNNRMIIDSATMPNTEAWLIKLLASGYNGGAWNGPGIDSSAAAAGNGTFGVGMADANDTTVTGLTSGQVELEDALYGDANLDGIVNGNDFTILATNFNKLAPLGWEQGDFNYSGAVNGSDFTLLVDNFNKSVTSYQDLTAIDSFAAANGIAQYVPEPTSLTLSAAIFTAALVRRRRC